MKKTQFNKKNVDNLRTLCKSWGGDIIEVNPDDWPHDWSFNQDPNFSLAPFVVSNLGINWRRKNIYYTDSVYWANLTHEMGHIFACSTPPENSEEWKFFGWEVKLVELIDGDMAEWKRNQKDYVITKDDRQFGVLSEKEKRDLISEKILEAFDRGLLDNKLNPISIR